MAIAEAFHFSERQEARQRVPYVKRCAKALYKIWFGEDATFESQFPSYRCRSVPVAAGESLVTVHTMAHPSRKIPTFLDVRVDMFLEKQNAKNK